MKLQLDASLHDAMADVFSETNTFLSSARYTARRKKMANVPLQVVIITRFLKLFFSKKDTLKPVILRYHSTKFNQPEHAQFISRNYTFYEHDGTAIEVVCKETNWERLIMGK